jgi:hypothetical protein
MAMPILTNVMPWRMKDAKIVQRGALSAVHTPISRVRSVPLLDRTPYKPVTARTSTDFVREEHCGHVFELDQG